MVGTEGMPRKEDGLSQDQGARRPQTLPLPFHAARTPEREAESLGPAAPWGRGQSEPAPLSRGPRSPRSQPLGHAVAPEPTVGPLSPARPRGSRDIGAAHFDDVQPAPPLAPPVAESRDSPGAA